MNFLDAFQNAYDGGGTGTPPGTTRELLDQGRQWAEEGGDPAALLMGVRNLRGQAARSHEATVKDLQTNPRLHPELREPMESSRDGFAGMEAALRDLETALEREDRDGAATLLDELEAAARRVGDAGRAMKAWLEAPVPRCPRCGATGAADCPSCGLDLLIPDPDHARNPTLKSAVLPPAFGGVYLAYVAAISGEVPLEALFEALDALDAEMREKRGYAAVYGRRMESEAAERLVATVDEVLAGIERMRQVAHTRRMRDLHEGWDMIFGSGKRVVSDTAEVLDEGGRETHGLHTATRTSDSVVLGGE